MNFSSKLIEEAVNAFSSLPGIGRKTALRLVLHLLNRDVSETERFVHPIYQMRSNIHFCTRCHNVSDDEVCSICKDNYRDKTTICVVESIRDVLAIEETGQYRGMYHVLGGVISPIDGIGPDDLNFDTLLERVVSDGIKELILAISPTIEGDTTAFYISKKINNPSISISSIARGVSFGGELEYVDELTLGRSIVARIPYDTNI